MCKQIRTSQYAMSNLEETSELEAFYGLAVAFVRRLRKPLRHTNRTSKRPNLFLGLSPFFCRIRTKVHSFKYASPLWAECRVQLRLSEFTDVARTVGFDCCLDLQNMDKQAEQGWKINQ